MGTSEAVILLINTTIIAIGYLFIYPKRCGNDINKLATNDFYSSVISISIAGLLFWGKEMEFDALFFSSNWFWFSLLTYFVIEVPVFIFYAHKNKMWERIKNTIRD